MSACGEVERSAEAYCDTYHSGFDRLKADYPEVDQYKNSDAHPVEMLLSLASAQGDIIALIGDMSEVAPDEIRTDVERVHDTMQEQVDASADVVDDPLQAITKQLIIGLTTTGAFRRMDQYTVEHCGEHMFTASPQEP